MVHFVFFEDLFCPPAYLAVNTSQGTTPAGHIGTLNIDHTKSGKEHEAYLPYTSTWHLSLQEHNRVLL